MNSSSLTGTARNAARGSFANSATKSSCTHPETTTMPAPLPNFLVSATRSGRYTKGIPRFVGTTTSKRFFSKRSSSSAG
ncbi:MAG: hypothetical protein A4E67_00971 [Syntrophaceae bacterium PtaB.Bin038]|nr:MAG: hypothetical protein A4E67_00971 [Syntrophaceae bacterium PtaB.Bin038]